MFVDVVLSTAHKAKGLEFSTVKVTDDYMATRQPLTNRTCIRSHVCHVLLYVCSCLQASVCLCVLLKRLKQKLQWFCLRLAELRLVPSFRAVP